ncbi:MAG: ferrochelatase, partial [Candidatus Omnitrophica bacterium]|nr:ferrochelatase [Candidatus Omnitrophota bacterium]
EPLPCTVIEDIKRKNKKYFLPLSLYPHYSAATTGSNLFYLHEESRRNYPELKFLSVPTYCLDPAYIAAFAERIREQIKSGESLDDFYLLFSAHGLPLYFLKEGDPYPFQIAQTVACVLKELDRQDHWMVSYQSDVGPLQWIKPSTENMLSALARRGVKKVLVVPISFVTDHIETLCEIDIEYRHMAQKAGIEDFRMSKALETHPGLITALANAVESLIRENNERKITCVKN